MIRDLSDSVISLTINSAESQEECCSPTVSALRNIFLTNVFAITLIEEHLGRSC